MKIREILYYGDQVCSSNCVGSLATFSKDMLASGFLFFAFAKYPLNDAPWCKLWIGHDWRDFLPFMARVNGNTWTVRRIDHAPFLGDVETRKMVTEKTIIF